MRAVMLEGLLPALLAFNCLSGQLLLLQHVANTPEKQRAINWLENDIARAHA